MKIGGMELILILALAVLVIGPSRAVVLARKAGKWLRVFRVYIGSMTEDLQETVVEPLQDIQEPLREITEPFDEISKDVTGAMNDITKPFEKVADDIERQTHEIEAEAKKNLSMKNMTGRADKKSSANAGNEPEDNLEMAEIIEDDPKPQYTSPAIADKEEAGGTI